jgi:hypothetical protein
VNFVARALNSEGFSELQSTGMEVENSKQLAENYKAEGNAHFEKKTYIPAAEAYQKGIEVRSIVFRSIFLDSDPLGLSTY